MPALHVVGALDDIAPRRVDMTGSTELLHKDINCPKVFETARTPFTKAKVRGMACALDEGGGKEAPEFMCSLSMGLLDGDETRKVNFGCAEGLVPEVDKGELKAVGFELMWFENERDFYGAISVDDKIRIDMQQARRDRFIEHAGGTYK